MDKDGAAAMLLTGNDTGGVVRLVSDGNGGGGVQFIHADTNRRRIQLRPLTFDDGEKRQTLPMG